MNEAPQTKAESAEEVPGAQALLRGLDVLMAIDAALEPMRFAELQKATGVPKGSLHRLLSALQSRDFVRFDTYEKRYSLGSKVFDMARRTLDQSTVIRAARPELSRLARQLGHAVCLYVRDGDEVFVLDFEDPDASQSRVVRVWPRLPTAASAPGLAMASLLGAADGPSAQLSQAKALGYAVVAMETAASVAAPVQDDKGGSVAAICCHAENLTSERLHETGRLIREAAERASRNLGLSAPIGGIAPRPERSGPGVRVLNTGRDFMGENPVWCARTQRLWWLDILAPALRWRDSETGTVGRTVLDDLTGGLALTEGGRIILAGRRGIQLFDPGTGKAELLIDPEAHRPENRFNSASLDAQGNIWVGTMPVDGKTGSGSLYRIGSRLSVDILLRDLPLPKNVAWTADGRTLLMSEGRSGVLSAYQVRDDGTLGAGRPLVTGSAETGYPNGISMDGEDNVWVAMLGGWSVNCYDMQGTLKRSIPLPVPMPTALTFGGADLDRIYVTSTYLRMPAGYSAIAPEAGNLIEIEAGVRGLEAKSFAL